MIIKLTSFVIFIFIDATLASLKMEAVNSCEAMVYFCQTTRRHTPEGSNIDVY